MNNKVVKSMKDIIGLIASFTGNDKEITDPGQVGRLGIYENIISKYIIYNFPQSMFIRDVSLIPEAKDYIISQKLYDPIFWQSEHLIDYLFEFFEVDFINISSNNSDKAFEFFQKNIENYKIHGDLPRSNNSRLSEYLEILYEDKDYIENNAEDIIRNKFARHFLESHPEIITESRKRILEENHNPEIFKYCGCSSPLNVIVNPAYALNALKTYNYWRFLSEAHYLLINPQDDLVDYFIKNPKLICFDRFAKNFNPKAIEYVLLNLDKIKRQEIYDKTVINLMNNAKAIYYLYKWQEKWKLDINSWSLDYLRFNTIANMFIKTNKEKIAQNLKSPPEIYFRVLNKFFYK